MEALRQSSPQRGARGAELAVPAALVALAASRVLDPGGHRHRADSRHVLVLAGLCAKTPGGAVGTTPDVEPALCVHTPLTVRLYAGVPALRGILQPGRDPAHALADAGGATPAARMERVRRARPQSP